MTRVEMEANRFFLLELNLKLVSSVSLYDSMSSLFSETISVLSVFSSDPLFSFAIAFCILVFLYLPHILWKIVFSPVLILTWVLLLVILRLGAIQKSQHEQEEHKENEDHGRYSEPVNEENRGSEEEKQRASPIEPKETKSIEQLHEWISSQKGFEWSSCFVEWNVKAPLEVIYEEYEGEEGEKEEAGEEHANEKEENQNRGVIQRYPSLSCYYPESDSDGSSESVIPAKGERNSAGNNCFFWWDDEDDKEGLIEIALDGCVKKWDMEIHFDEENLIEIDISSMRCRQLSGEDEEVFSGDISCH